MNSSKIYIKNFMSNMSLSAGVFQKFFFVGY